MSIDAVFDVLLADERWKSGGEIGDVGVGAIRAHALIGELVLFVED